MRLPQVITSICVTTALLVGCAAVEKQPGAGQPAPNAHPPTVVSECVAQEPPVDASADQKLSLAVSKDVARPGEQLAITVQGDPATKVTRGVDAYLECWNGQAWVTKFVFVLNTQGGANVPTVQPSSPNLVIIALGLVGPGPEPVKLPDELPPGWYRIRKRVSVDGGPQADPRTLYARIRVADRQ